jgi:outer membrane protein assembly factor BamB
VVWNAEVFQQEPGHKQDKNSDATPTPATDGERVYAVFGDGSFAAVNQDGSVVWINRDTKFYSQHGLGASPLLYGDLLIMPFDGSSRGPDTKVGWQVPWENAAIVALDKKTGKERWRATRGPSRIAHVSPMIIRASDHDELLSCAGDVIQGFNPDTGERLWTVRSEGEGVVPSPAFSNDFIFTVSGFGKPTIRTVRTGARAELTDSHIAWEQRKGVPTQSSLVYASDHVYAVTDGGVAACFAAGSGDVVWQERLGGSFCASPVAAGDRIYFLSEQGDTSIVKAGPKFEVLAKNSIGEPCQASMAVSEGKLFIRSNKHLWCIGR